MRFALALLGMGLLTSSAFTQSTGPAWSYPQLTTVMQPTAPLPQVPPSSYVPADGGPIPTGLPERTVLAVECPPENSGQQHWVSLNLGIFQPFTGRVAVKVWPRENNSVWLEAYGGSVLFDAMFGFGARVQHTAVRFRGGDQLMISPGVGLHVVPNWRATTRTRVDDPYFGHYYTYDYSRNALYYLAGDVDISWLHDFSPHFGYEIGLKLGIAGRLAGTVGRDYPRGVMWGKDFYPIVSVYSGFRF